MSNHTQPQQIVIDERYAGVPGIALGGYSGGLVAEALATPSAAVKLRRPVPMGRPLGLVQAPEGRMELRDGETVLAIGQPAPVDPEIPEPPAMDEARNAGRRFTGFSEHPFPACFACGIEHPHGSGLGVFPGRDEERGIVATVWTPGAEVAGPHSLALIWSAFDCTQLWALMEFGQGRRAERAVTASLAGRLERPVKPGVAHVLVGWPIDRDGPRHRAGAALFDPEGGLCAVGVQTAITAEWGVPLDFGHRRRVAAPAGHADAGK